MTDFELDFTNDSGIPIIKTTVLYRLIISGKGTPGEVSFSYYTDGAYPSAWHRFWQYLFLGFIWELGDNA